MSIFKKASKVKLRFSSVKGQVSTEDLWDLPMSKLRDMANTINRSLKTSDDLFAVLSPGEETVKLRLSIVVAVIEARATDSANAVEEAERGSKRKMLKEMIAKKTIEAHGAQSIEELEAELAKT